MFSILLINDIWYIHVALVHVHRTSTVLYTVRTLYSRTHVQYETGVNTRRKFVESVKTLSVARKRL